MKTRESGMPPEEIWSRFFEPKSILEKLAFTAECRNVVEFGSGYGTFTIPAAEIISGTVYALDIDEEMLSHTRFKLGLAHLKNVHLLHRDFAMDGTGLSDASVDYAMLFNLLHAEERMELLQEAWRVLEPGGTLGVIHWNHDSKTPRGPSMSIRPRPEECRDWSERVGFQMDRIGLIDLPPYHYGYIFRKPESSSV